MAARTVRLLLTVKYEYDDDKKYLPSYEECAELLNSLVAHAANNGLLTGESSMVVDDYRHSIENVSME